MLLAIQFAARTTAESIRKLLPRFYRENFRAGVRKRNTAMFNKLKKRRFERIGTSVLWRKDYTSVVYFLV
jgi:hypothetical protein